MQNIFMQRITAWNVFNLIFPEKDVVIIKGLLCSGTLLGGFGKGRDDAPACTLKGVKRANAVFYTPDRQFTSAQYKRQACIILL